MLKESYYFLKDVSFCAMKRYNQLNSKDKEDIFHSALLAYYSGMMLNDNLKAFVIVTTKNLANKELGKRDAQRRAVKTQYFRRVINPLLTGRINYEQLLEDRMLIKFIESQLKKDCKEIFNKCTEPDNEIENYFCNSKRDTKPLAVILKELGITRRKWEKTRRIVKSILKQQEC
jgi:hypothetical protein